MAHFGLVVQFVFALLQFEMVSMYTRCPEPPQENKTERNVRYILLFVFEPKFPDCSNIVEYKCYNNGQSYICVVVAVKLILLRSFGFLHRLG